MACQSFTGVFNAFILLIEFRFYNCFLYSKQLADAASTGSVEQRVRSNAYNIQRSKFSMDTNFARR